MLTVKEVSKLAGVSIRTLHYYDQITLLEPTEITEAGYRLYDDVALERLQQILLFRELEFSLKEIKGIIESDNFNRNKALTQQIELLRLKKEHIENLITFARGIKLTGVKNMDFKVFDSSKIDEYTKEAKRQWGNTDAYKEFEEKEKKRSKEDSEKAGKEMMSLFTEFGEMMEYAPEADMVQVEVKKLQDYITENFYKCTDEILQGLGGMYSGGGEFTENIDAYGGKGCADFVSKAIEIYCQKRINKI